MATARTQPLNFIAPESQSQNRSQTEDVYVLPTSFAQQRLWFLDQLEPASPLYNITSAVLLQGPLQLPALSRTFDEIISRHETLRTTFAVEEEMPVQVVSEARHMPLMVQDESGKEELEQERAMQEVLKGEEEAGFDLRVGPLLRVRVVKMGEERHVVVLTMHHIISDGWSMEVLMKEIGVLYRAYVAGIEPELEELSIQYGDYAVWQRDLLQGEALEKELSYWRKQLGVDLPVLELPVDRTRPPVRSYRGAHLPLHICAELTKSLRELSQQQDCTLYMTLLAAFQTLLSRYSGEDDIIVGTPIAGRTRAEVEPLIGLFVNTLVLRTDLRGEPTFIQLQERVREVCLGAYAHQEVPFEKLVEEFQPERDLSRTPLFQVMFVLQTGNTGALLSNVEATDAPRTEKDLRIAPLASESRMAKFDLTLSLAEMGDSINGTLEFNTDIFDASTIHRFISHFLNLLSAVVSFPELPITRLPLLSHDERQHLLELSRESEVVETTQGCLHQLFEAQVQKAPDSVALSFQNEHLSYAQLNERANPLAHHLRSLGVGPETLVGICLERSLEMVVGLLAILKAGAAYVPLDPSYPQERLSFMMDDAGISVLLTQQRLLEKLPSHWALTIAMDSEWETISAYPTENLAKAEVLAENLAYITYTSGSTGTPKGVSIPHRAVSSLLLVPRFLLLDERQVMLQLAPLSFDASTFELWGSLINGARLVIAPPHQPSLDELCALIRHQQVSTLWLTAGLFHLLVDERPDELAMVRQMVAGGDVLSLNHVRRFLERAPQSLFINGYGPTESTTFTCCEEVRDIEELARQGNVPIGKVVGGREAYVLDARGEMVGEGVWGELWIGGEGLGRGYVGRAEETAERFMPDRWSGREGRRLYGSGDVVRWREGGKLEYGGRRDGQVKVRGYRIELGEVERVMEEERGVREAVLIARMDADGDRRLVAYFVAESDNACDVDELRARMRAKLPEHQIPSAFVEMKELPLTKNGKVDRDALLSERGVEECESPQFAPPGDSLEVQLLSIWEDVLKVGPIGVKDNFFTLGGHSLQAVRLISQIYERIGQDLPVAALFENPTIEKLASILRERNWPGVLKLVDDLPQVDSPLVSIQPAGEMLPFFFVSALGGILPSNVISSVLDLAPHLDPNQPFYGLQLPGLVQPLSRHLSSNVPIEEHKLGSVFAAYLRENPPMKIIREGAALCIEAMRQAQPTGPYHLAGFCSGGIIAYEIACQLEQQGEEVGMLLLMDANAPTSKLLALRGIRQEQSEPESGATMDDANRAMIDDAEDASETSLDPEVKRIGWFICKDLAGSRLDKKLREVYRELGELEPDARWEYALELLKSGGEVSDETKAEDIHRLYLIYKVNADSIQFILRNYEPQRYSGPLTLFRVNDLSDVGDDLTLGWSMYATKPVDVQVVDGDHGTFFHGENLLRLARRLTACLDQAQAIEQLSD